LFRQKMLLDLHPLY